MLLLLRASPKVDRKQVALDRKDFLLAILMAAVAFAAFSRTLNFGFLSDDFILVHRAVKEQTWLSAVFTHGGGDGFFRPLGHLSFSLTALFAGSDDYLWHASSIALHAVNTALFFLLARKFGLTPSSAVFAAMLSAIHGTRPETVAWITARFDLVMLFFVLCALLLYQCEGVGASVLAFLCMLAALLSKEAAYAFPLLLLLFGPVQKAIPYFLGTAAMFAYRWVLLGGIGGYKSAGSDEPAVMHFGLLSALKVFALRLWSALYVPINRAAEPSHLLLALTTLYLAVLIWTLWRGSQIVDQKQSVRAMLFLLLASLPPLHQLLIGADLEKSRHLNLAVVGFCLLFGVWFDAQAGRARQTFFAIVLLFHFGALWSNLNVWEEAADKAAITLEKASACIGPNRDSATVSGLPRIYKGVYFFANGFPEGLEMLRGKPVSINHGESGGAVLTWDAGKQELRCVE
jgi:hypothetical protein